MRARILCIALLLAALQFTPATASGVAPTPNSVVINPDGSMTVDGAPFRIKGIAYSLVPTGESERSGVMGDYFTPDYAYMWVRDFPRLKAMGINSLRIYTWNPAVDHRPFLDVCHQYGLKVLLTHGIGFARDNPLLTDAQRQDAITKFVDEVKMLGDHPAILMWSFGNELNGWWLGFLDNFNEAYNCNWNHRQPWDNNGCMGNRDPTNAGFAACQAAQNCLYPKFFGFLDEALRQAKQYSTRPMTATFADIDFIISNTPQTDLIPRFGQYMTHFDVYAFQLYRGHSFGEYFQQYKAETNKPLMVAEYGIDAMNDPCGWPENFNSMRPCSVWSPGQNGQPGGADVPADPSKFVGCWDTSLACHVPGVVAQAQWDTDLTTEILNSYALGGFLFEWQDEFWKSVETQDHCAQPCPFSEIEQCSNPSNPKNLAYREGGAAGCSYKAHLSCGNQDSNVQDLCGYFLWGAPDNYVNEAWFGLNGVVDCGNHKGSGATASHHLNTHKPRPIVNQIASVFGGHGNEPVPTCDALRGCWTCTTSHTHAEITSGVCNTQCGLKFVGPELPPPTTGTPSSSTGAAPVDPTPDPVPGTTSSTGVSEPDVPDGGVVVRGSAGSLAPSALCILLIAALMALIQ